MLDEICQWVDTAEETMGSAESALIGDDLELVEVQLREHEVKTICKSSHAACVIMQSMGCRREPHLHTSTLNYYYYDYTKCRYL